MGSLQQTDTPRTVVHGLNRMPHPVCADGLDERIGDLQHEPHTILH